MKKSIAEVIESLESFNNSNEEIEEGVFMNIKPSKFSNSSTFNSYNKNKSCSTKYSSFEFSMNNETNQNNKKQYDHKESNIMKEREEPNMNQIFDEKNKQPNILLRALDDTKEKTNFHQNQNKEKSESIKIGKTLKDYNKYILGNIDNQPVNITEAYIPASLLYSCNAIDIKPKTVNVTFEICEFLVQVENNPIEFGQNISMREASYGSNSNKEENKSSEKSYNYESNSKSESKEDQESRKEQQNQRSHKNEDSSEESKSSSNSDTSSVKSQDIDFDDFIELQNEEEKTKYVVLLKEGFNRINRNYDKFAIDEEYKCFSQHTRDGCIIKKFNLCNKLWINCMMTNKELLSKYIMCNEELKTICIDNIEMNLNSCKDNEHWKVKCCLEDTDPKFSQI